MTHLSISQRTRTNRAHIRLATHVRQARRRCGWSQQDLALQMGASVSTVRRLERGDPGVALPLVLSGALRLGLLRKFNRLLDCRIPAHTGAAGGTLDVQVNAKLALPSEARVLLPQGPCGLRLADRLTISLDEPALPFGELQQRPASNGVSTAFTYDPLWLDHKRFFSASPDLRAIRSSQRRRGRKEHKASSWGAARHLEVFGALEDTVPSGFGARVVERARDRSLLDALRPPGQRPNTLDEMCVVLDIARLGALRVSPGGQPLSDAHEDRLLLPRWFDLNAMAAAAMAFEQNTEDPCQLLLLLYAATALPGERPKCTWIDPDGRLAVAKFASALDAWAVNRGEVLAMCLAKKAGIDVIDVKLMHPVSAPILVALRLDRSENGGRLPFLSARSLMSAQTSQVVDHLDLLPVMRRCCLDFGVDGPKLWKRLVFKCLIQDTSDDLRKIGFVYAGNNRWNLAPACGLRMRPSTVNEPHGDHADGAHHRVTLQTLVEQADAFGVDPAQVRLILRSQLNVLAWWKQWASEFAVNMSVHDVQQIEPAMNNPQTQWARRFLTT